MPRIAAVLAFAFALVSAPPHAAAQDAGSARPVLAWGTRVRVIAPSMLGPITGTVVSHDANLLTLRTDAHGDTLRLPTASLVSLEVRAGQERRILRGAAVGLLAGAGIGALLGYATYEEARCTPDSFFCFDFGPETAALGGAAVLGGVGVLAGALFGAKPTEIWAAPESLPGGARIGIAPAPRAGGVQLTASLRF